MVVIDMDENEPVWRCGRSGEPTITGVERFGDSLRRPTAAADQHERPGDGPDHVVQEPIGLNIDPEKPTDPVHSNSDDRPDATGPVGPMGLEAPEVVAALKRLGGPTHRFEVEPYWHMMTGSSMQRRWHRPVVEDIAVHFGACVEGGVEGLGLIKHLKDPDIVGEIGVEGADEDLGRIGGGGIEVSDLTDGMDPRIGPS